MIFIVKSYNSAVEGFIIEIGGRETFEIEKMNDQQVAEFLQPFIDEAFPDAPFHINMKVTRWGLDEFSLGSYSYPSVGSTANVRKDIGASIKGRIFFAGEHVSRHPAYVHGMRKTFYNTQVRGIQV